jgi:integrase
MRPSKGPYLEWRKPRPKKRQAGRWVIIDSGRETSTGYGEGQRKEAERVLAQYILNSGKPEFSDGDPTKVLIGHCLTFYSQNNAPKALRAQVMLGCYIDRLAEFCGDEVVAYITPKTRDAYIEWRCKQTDARFKRNGRPVSLATAKRELVTLRAAINYCAENNNLRYRLKLRMPKLPEPDDRSLTRSELARLLWGALGWDLRGKKPTRNRFRINYHVARFILIAYYTATRHDAILKLGWGPSTYGGWFDLEQRVLHRRPRSAIETAKRRLPTAIPDDLLPHLRRWRKLTARFVIEYNGEHVRSSQKRGFASAVELADLGKKVTPHWLKHTCITHMLQAGKSPWEVAGFAGTTEQIIRSVYGHHTLEHVRSVANDVFSRKRRIGRAG